MNKEMDAARAYDAFLSLNTVDDQLSFELQFTQPDNRERAIVVCGTCTQHEEAAPGDSMFWTYHGGTLLNGTDLTAIGALLNERALDVTSIEYYAIINSRNASIIVEHHVNRDEAYKNGREAETEVGLLTSSCVFASLIPDLNKRRQRN